MPIPARVRTIMKREGLEDVNTPKHPTKSHVVMAEDKGEFKLIRFGQQGADTKPPRKGESEADKAKRAAFKARHAENIKKGKMSAAYWADKVKW